MKISVAQIRPIKGDILANIKKHVRFIELAASLKAGSVFFPELSLTGYEPELADNLATTHEDSRLDVIQKFSDSKNMTVGIGIPTKTEKGIRISMVVFQPGKQRQSYSKQQLHADELPYFIPGDQQLVLTVDNKKVAPAICFESLQPNHAGNSYKLGADLYVASVAKSQNGVNKALAHYPEIAKKYTMPVLMSNCIGPCDNFVSVGCSAVWTKNGHLVGQLDDQNEGILVFDSETEEVIKRLL